jgi:hypothetical protein
VEIRFEISRPELGSDTFIVFYRACMLAFKYLQTACRFRKQNRRPKSTVSVTGGTQFFTY